MKRFVVRYFLFLGLLFTTAYMPFTPFASVLNDLQTAMTLKGLALFLAPEEIDGVDILINPHYKIIITQACNGFIPVFFLWAALWAYPASWKKRIVWSFAAYAIFSVVNILRILTVVHFVKQEGGRANFYWSHDLLGNALLMAVGLTLFYLYLRTQSSLARKNR